MKTNKEEACEKMLQYAKKIAKQHGLNCVKENMNTFWADFGTVEYKFTDGKSNENRLVYRMRFGCPRIDLHIGKDLASVELGDSCRNTGEKDEKGNDVMEHDGVFRPKETQSWGSNGIHMLVRMWEDLANLIHIPSNDFIE